MSRPAAGLGASLRTRFISATEPVADATITLVRGSHLGKSNVSLTSRTDQDGWAKFAYDPGQWFPAMQTVEPVRGCWNWYQLNPTTGATTEIAELPKTGPPGWWHRFAGIEEYSLKRGEGIKIGIIDTGSTRGVGGAVTVAGASNQTVPGNRNQGPTVATSIFRIRITRFPVRLPSANVTLQFLAGNVFPVS